MPKVRLLRLAASSTLGVAAVFFIFFTFVYSGSLGPALASPPADVLLAPSDNVTHTGYINTNTTWTATTHIVSGKLVISPTAILTVAPGAVVKFTGGANAAARQLEVKGELRSLGTAAQPVIFTSYNASPAPGDWGYVGVSAGGKAALAYTQILYGGAGSSVGALSVTGAGPATSLSMANSVVSWSAAAGLKVTPQNGPLTPTITSSQFTYNNGVGILVQYSTGWGVPSVGGTNVIANNKCGLTTGSLFTDTVNLAGAIGAPSGKLNWSLGPQANYVYGLADQSLTVNSNVTLTLKPGFILKSKSQYPTSFALFSIKGKLLANGLPTLPITLTSVHDNKVGPRTGNKAPEPRNWDGVKVETGGQATLSFITERYAINGLSSDNGAGTIRISNCRATTNTTGLNMLGGQVVVSATEVAGNTSYGVYGNNYGTPSTNLTLRIVSSTIRNNTTSGVYVKSASPNFALSGSTLSKNNGDGLTISPRDIGYSPTLTNNLYISNTGAAIVMDYDRGYGWPTLASALPLTQAIRGNGLNMGFGLKGTWGPAGQSFTWSNSDPNFERVVWGELIIPGSVVLTVPSGEVVKFRPGASKLNIQGSGILNALGTPTLPITFTSSDDNSVGRPVGSGNTQTGRWGNLTVAGRGNLTHLVVRYGGSTDNGAIYANGGQVYLSDSQVYSNSTHGLSMRQNDIAGTRVFVTDTLFYHNGSSINGGGVLLSGGPLASVRITGCQVISNYNPYGAGVRVAPASGIFRPTIRNTYVAGNAGAGIWVNYSGGGGVPIITGTTVITHNGLDNAIGLSGNMGGSNLAAWSLGQDPNFDYVLWSGDLQVNPGFTLTLLSDLVLKGRSGTGFKIAGRARVESPATQPVLFTSFNDNSVGRPLGTGNPAAGNWTGVTVANGGQATLSDIIVRYATGGVRPETGSYLTLTNSLLDHNTDGVQVKGGRVVLSSVQLVSNADYGLHTDPGTFDKFILNVASSTISGNLKSGVYARLRPDPSLGTFGVLTLTNSTMQWNGGAGVTINPASDKTYVTGTLSSNQYISNTGPAILIEYSEGSGWPLVAGSNVFSGNAVDHGIALRGTLKSANPINLQPDPLGDLVVYGDLTIAPNVRVVVQPDTVLKLITGTNVLIDTDGRLIFDGTLEHPVYVTSIDDDSVGQTNSNGGVFDRWGALVASVAPGGTRGYMSLKSAIVRYGSRYRYLIGSTPNAAPGMIAIKSSGRLEAQSSEIEHGSYAGVYVTDGSSAALTDTLLSRNTYGLHMASGASVNLYSSMPVDFPTPTTICTNTQYGIYGENTLTLNANRVKICNNNRGGIYLPAAAGQVWVERSDIRGNGGAGIHMSGIGAATVNRTDFVNNTAGITNTNSSMCVAATNNWWGHPNGPYDPASGGSCNTTNDNPSGQRVNNYVTYDPWLLQSARAHGLVLMPPYNVSLVPLETRVLNHTLTNTGDDTDVFVLTYTASYPAWVTGFYPTQAVQLESGEAATVLVTVSVPAGILSGTQNSLSIQGVNLLGDASGSVADTLVVGAAPQAALAPMGSLAGQNKPGQHVTYTFIITNQSNYVESYYLAASAGWPVTATFDSSAIAIGQHAHITASLLIPEGTLSGTVNSRVLDFASTPGQQVVTNATVTTTVLHQPGIQLDGDHSNRVKQGRTYTYIHSLTNTGNYTDTYSISAISTIPTWSYGPPSIIVPPNSQKPVYLTVTVPSNAITGTVYVSVLTATSVLSPVFHATNVNTTTAGPFISVTLSPDQRWAAAPPGELHVFTYTIHNAGDDPDAIHLTVLATDPGWLVGYRPATAELNPGASATGYITMRVPAGQISGTLSTATLTVTSGLDASVYATATATLVAQRVTQLALQASHAVDMPGAQVTIAPELRNTGNYTDEFDITYRSAAWPAVFHLTTPVQMGPDQTQLLTFTVSIPTGSGGQTNAVVVTATSRTDSGVWASVSNIVTARAPGVTLSGGHIQNVLPGQRVIYTHTLTNDGNTADSFAVAAVSSQGWAAYTPHAVSLNIGQATVVIVTVTVPSNAGDVVDTTAITATSQTTPGVYATASDTTKVLVGGVALSAGQTQEAVAGQIVTFTHRITNTANIAQTANITLVPPAGYLVTVTPTQTGSLAAYTGSMLVTVQVHVPAAALSETVEVQVNATGALLGAASAKDALSVKKGIGKIYLPLVMKNS